VSCQVALPISPRYPVGQWGQWGQVGQSPPQPHQVSELRGWHAQGAVEAANQAAI
jgi:hypothetical protein